MSAAGEDTRRPSNGGGGSAATTVDVSGGGESQPNSAIKASSPSAAETHCGVG